MKKDEAIFFRVSKAVKKAAEQAAADDERPLAALAHLALVKLLSQRGYLK